MAKFLILPFVAMALATWTTAAAGLEEKTEGNVRYVSGGVGQSEMDEIRRAAPRYNLDLMFATTQGNYLSDVEVTIRGKDGDEVLNATSGGPRFLADLPPGRYTVEASVDGQTQSRNVDVGEGERRALDMRWPGGNMSGINSGVR